MIYLTSCCQEGHEFFVCFVSQLYQIALLGFFFVLHPHSHLLLESIPLFFHSVFSFLLCFGKNQNPTADLHLHLSSDESPQPTSCWYMCDRVQLCFSVHVQILLCVCVCVHPSFVTFLTYLGVDLFAEEMSSSSSSSSSSASTCRPAQRWSDREMELLQEVRSVCAPALALQPPYPEVVGDRRLIRFIRGQHYDLDKISSKVSRHFSHMLAWSTSVHGLWSHDHMITWSHVYMRSRIHGLLCWSKHGLLYRSEHQRRSMYCSEHQRRSRQSLFSLCCWIIRYSQQ